MNKMTHADSQVKHDSATTWPSWTDEDRWVPTETDEAEHAALSGEWDDDGPAFDNPIWDVWAAEAEAQRQLEAGLRMF